MNVQIEIENGYSCNGSIKKIDKFKNLTLSNVIITNLRGNLFKSYSKLFIKGRMIKMVRFV